MAARDWSKPRVDRTRAEASSARRLEGADPYGQASHGTHWVLCERCSRQMPKGTPMRRVSASEAPSGEGGYVHTDPCPNAFVKES